MFQFILEGGIAMIVILIFGLVTLATAVQFALRPESHRLRFIIAMAIATLFAALNGLFAGVASTFHFVTSNEELRKGPDFVPVLLQGVSESLSNPITGFTLLTLAAFVTAIGLRRMPRA